MNIETLNELLQVGNLIRSSIDTVKKLNDTSRGDLPAKPLFDAQRTLLSAAGKLTELVSQPSIRLLEVSSQYFEARCLHILADKRIPDLLAKGGNQGLHVKTIAESVGIEERKLCEQGKQDL